MRRSSVYLLETLLLTLNAAVWSDKWLHLLKLYFNKLAGFQQFVTCVALLYLQYVHFIYRKLKLWCQH